jgi:hypothetical protein
MIRKMLVVAAAIAMPASVIAATGGLASAGGVTVNATTYSISCTGLTGSAKFNPGLMLTTGSPTETVSLKAALSGCTATPSGGGAAITSISGSASGTIHSDASAGCTGLNGAATDTGTLTVKWKATPKLSSGSTVFSVNTVTGGTDPGSATTPQFVLSSPNSVSGSFQGSDGGASSVITADSTSNEGAVVAACGGKKGLTKLGLTHPASGAAVTLS